MTWSPSRWRAERVDLVKAEEYRRVDHQVRRAVFVQVGEENHLPLAECRVDRESVLEIARARPAGQEERVQVHQGLLVAVGKRALAHLGLLPVLREILILGKGLVPDPRETV